ncbi:MAG: carboxypeptidase-like regulatory domain-containing protein [Chloroflexota bacterium]
MIILISLFASCASPGLPSVTAPPVNTVAPTATSTPTSPPSSAPSAPATLQGLVIDSESGRPVVGAVISISERRATTDAIGAYSFQNLESGELYFLGSVAGNQTMIFGPIKILDGESRVDIELDVFSGKIKNITQKGTGDVSFPDTLPEYSDTGVLLKNPTWDELLDFLAEDDTDRHQYVYDYPPKDVWNPPNSPPFMSDDYAKMLQQNAKAAGWRCAVVNAMVNGAPYFVNAFQTTDKGLVYIDDARIPDLGPTTPGGPLLQDKTVDFQTGMEEILFPMGWTCPPTRIVIDAKSLRW